MARSTWRQLADYSQDIFIIPDGAPGALAELERRKFTAEEGVRVIAVQMQLPLTVFDQDHLTLLNGNNESLRSR